MIKQNTTFSIQIQKQKQLFVKVALIMYLNQSTLKNYTIQKKGWLIFKIFMTINALNGV